MVILKIKMFLHGVSIQLLNARLAAFMQKKILWKWGCSGTSSLVLFNISEWECTHTKSSEPGGEMYSPESIHLRICQWAESETYQKSAFSSPSRSKSTVIACCTPHLWEEWKPVHWWWYTNSGKMHIFFFPCAQRSSRQFRGQQWICSNLKNINSTFSCDSKTENYLSQGEILLPLKTFLKGRIIYKPCYKYHIILATQYPWSPNDTII